MTFAISSAASNLRSSTKPSPASAVYKYSQLINCLRNENRLDILNKLIALAIKLAAMESPSAVVIAAIFCCSAYHIIMFNFNSI